MTPRYVLTSITQAAATARRLASEGWQIHEGFALPDTPWDISASRAVLVGLVDDATAAADAVLAAERGAGIVATVGPDSDIAASLVAELARVGPVARTADGASTPGPPLTPEQRALLDRLAAGASIAAAAEAEFISLRTANRRIADARRTLGVRTTRQAVAEYLRLLRG
jgi:DNA-binding CsgD family transcriptional regulator